MSTTNSHNPSHTFVKIFCQTRNEYDLLEDFILYHAYIFGYDSLVLLDHNSTHPHVLALYEQYKQKGVHIEYEHELEYNQHVQTTRVMLKYQSTANFLMVLDTDEFIGCVGDESSHENRMIDRNQILQQLYQLPKDCGKIYYNYFCFMYPSSTHIKYPAQQNIHFSKTTCYKKVFFNATHFVQCYTGSHNGEVNGGQEILESGLIHFHYHFTGTKRMIEKCKEHVHGFGHVNVMTMSDKEQFTNLHQLMKQSPNHLGFHRTKQYVNSLYRRQLVIAIIKQHIHPTVELVEACYHHCKECETAEQLTERLIPFLICGVPIDLITRLQVPLLTDDYVEPLIYPLEPLSKNCQECHGVQCTLQFLREKEAK